VLDRSPFYGEAGGQTGDAGAIDAPRGSADVARTTWTDDVLVHHATVRQGALSVQDPVRARVDAERRLRVARSHTAAHLLHWALRKVLGPETVQAGSFVEAERVRFDFSSLRALHQEQREQVEALVNSRVRLADEVQATSMPLELARRAGALALFGEKYGSTVRVVTIGDYSKELCGGTHLPHTGCVGSFLITAESSIAAGTRRIEAFVGEAAAHQQQEHARLLHDVARRLGRPAGEVVAGLEELLERLKRAERERKTLHLELASVQARGLAAQATDINGVSARQALALAPALDMSEWIRLGVKHSNTQQSDWDECGMVWWIRAHDNVNVLVAPLLAAGWIDILAAWDASIEEAWKRASLLARNQGDAATLTDEFGITSTMPAGAHLQNQQSLIGKVLSMLRSF